MNQFISSVDGKVWDYENVNRDQNIVIKRHVSKNFLEAGDIFFIGSMIGNFLVTKKNRFLIEENKMVVSKEIK